MTFPFVNSFRRHGKSIGLILLERAGIAQPLDGERAAESILITRAGDLVVVTYQIDDEWIEVLRGTLPDRVEVFKYEHEWVNAVNDLYLEQENS